MKEMGKLRVLPPRSTQVAVTLLQNKRSSTADCSRKVHELESREIYCHIRGTKCPCRLGSFTVSANTSWSEAELN